MRRKRDPQRSPSGQLSWTRDKPDRNWLKGAFGDEMQAALRGADHTLRMIPRTLRFLWVLVLAALLNRRISAGVMA